jgi:C1q domain
MANTDFRVKNGLTVDGDATIGANSSSNVPLTISNTGAIKIPVGNTSQRPTGANGYIRYNSETSNFEGYNGSWSVLNNVAAVTSVGGTGTVAGITLSGTVTSTGNLTLGGTLSVPIANISATGTTDSTTFLRGDGTWATPAAGGSMVYPGSGITNSTGSAWGTSYSTSGSGNVVLTTTPTFTTSIDSGSTFGAFPSATILTIGYQGSNGSVVYISNVAQQSGSTKTITIGANGVSGSTTNVNIGSSVSGALGSVSIYQPLTQQLKVSRSAISGFNTTTTSGHLILTDSSNTPGNFTDIDFNNGNNSGVPYSRIAGYVGSRSDVTAGTVQGGFLFLGNNIVTASSITLTGATTNGSGTMTLTFAATVTSWGYGSSITVSGLVPTQTSGTVNNVNGTFTVIGITPTSVSYALTGTYSRTSGGTVSGTNTTLASGPVNEVVIDPRGYVGIGNTYPGWPLHIANPGNIDTVSFVTAGTGTGYNLIGIANGNNTLYLGVEGVLPGDVFTGDTAYSTVIGSASAYSMHLVTNGAISQTISSLGYITKPRQPSFMASAGYIGSTGVPYLFGTTTGLNPQGGTTGNVDHNISGSYSTSTGRFTAPVAGRYRFHACIMNSASNSVQFYLRKNGSNLYYGQDSKSFSGYSQGHVDVILNLAANDYIDIVPQTYNAYGNSSTDYFCGYLVA